MLDYQSNGGDGGADDFNDSRSLVLSNSYAISSFLFLSDVYIRKHGTEQTTFVIGIVFALFAWVFLYSLIAIVHLKL